MYVQNTESAAEKWCKENKVDVPTLTSIDEMIGYVKGESRCRVERSFDSLPQDFRNLLLAIAKLDTSDLTSIHNTGFKLRHYTKDGQLKIARAFRKVRLLSSQFPQNIREWEFTQIDKTLEG